MKDTLGILTVYDAIELSTVGVYQNMVYDIIPSVEGSSGSVIVNATTFSIDCAALPDAQQGEFLDDGDQNSTSSRLESFSPISSPLRAHF